MGVEGFTMRSSQKCEACTPLVPQWYYGVLVTIGVAVAFIGVAINFVQGEIVRQLENVSKGPFNWTWAYIWVGCFVAPTMLEALRSYLGLLIQNRLIIQDRHDLTELLARVRYETHEGSTFREDIQFLEKNSWRHWQYLYAHFQLIGASISTITGAIALLYFSWKAVVALLIAAIPLYLVTSHFGRRWYQVADEIAEPGYRSGCISEQFTRLKPVGLIKMFGLEELLLSLFGDLNKQIVKLQEKTNREDLVARVIANGLMQTMGACVVLTIIRILANSDLSMAETLLNKGVKTDLGLLTTAIGLTGGFIFGIQSLVSLQGSLAQHGPYMQKRRAFENSVKAESPGSLEPIEGDGLEVQFVNVWFKYPNSPHWVFRNLNLTLRSGERIALLGDNGAGKSTLFKLLSGLYTPTRGQILINGQSLSSLDGDEYRRKVAFMLQDQEPLEGITVSQLVSGKLALTEGDVDRVIEVCERTGANVFIERLPQGYDSPVGPKTTRSDLSGGEQQRLALAQVLFRRPRLALLDEPTSALDFGGKEKILQILGELPEKTGFIVAAHEPLVMSLVTRIIVLERGGAITDHTLTSGTAISSPYFEKMSRTYRTALGL